MSFKHKYTYDEKAKILLEYQAGVHGFRELCRIYGIAQQSLKDWIRLYETFGMEGLKTGSSATHYSRETKQAAVQDYLAHKLPVKEILKKNDVNTINAAVQSVGLSRSAYYKYKDYVFPFYEASKDKIITLSLLLEHKSGVLSRVLNLISTDSGNIMTINQGIPLQGVANTTISIETKNMTVDLEALLDKLRTIDGVKRLEVLGQV